MLSSTLLGLCCGAYYEEDRVLTHKKTAYLQYLST